MRKDVREGSDLPKPLEREKVRYEGVAHPKQAKALAILRDHPGCTANTFAALYFTEPSRESLFTAVSNQGNGACAGKKAWLCAGSLLGKLAKRGLIRRDYGSGTGRFYLTYEGENKLKQTTHNHA